MFEIKNYQKLNNIIGWFVFIIASSVYIITSETTASFWDCGEYIATSYKVMVGHPPGAPTFQLFGRFFSLFAFGNEALVARMVNTMSALASGFTILFLFWSITMLAKKVVATTGEMTKNTMFAILGSGLVGALAYTFSDSFWFSAVEGEVYATSSFFTAIVFWAMLKWEVVADKTESWKWIILVAFLMGLSIGVHLLNILTIPSMTLIYYYKKYKTTIKGTILAFVLSIILLATVMYGIIPGIVSLSAKFELFFVNSLGMAFNMGTIIYFLIIIGLIIWGLYYTNKKKKIVYNTIILCFTFLLIGYSSFLILVIRSNANTPINENAPKNAISLLAYLNREQYGESPLISGQYYNAPVTSYKDGSPLYERNDSLKKYVVIDDRKGSIPVYDSRFTTFFPRMYDPQQDHVDAYKTWAGIDNEAIDCIPIQVNSREGEPKTLYKPTFAQNLKYFFNYQIGFMYLRYFMWNFVGRQNDIEGNGNPLEGNWISGIDFIDQWRLGCSQENLPEVYKNKGTNKLYFLPLILGLIGFFFHLKKTYKDNIVIILLFIMTGFAIVVYLNQYPNQPRERDYAYAASFYAFAIWIGLGVLALIDYVGKRIKQFNATIPIILVCTLCVPVLMAAQEWDDHDRSTRTTCVDFASNYLNSCAPNAILFTNGDNDTFPLWYAQEVEGIRTDVRVCNLSLFNTDWYIDQMKRKAYNSDAMPMTMTRKQYHQGSREMVYFIENENLKGYTNLKDLIDFVASDNPDTKFATDKMLLDYFPTKNFRLPVEKAPVLSNGGVPAKFRDSIVDAIEWKMKPNVIGKNHLMVLDFLATNKWKRPVYFAVTTGGENYLGLDRYFQLEGLAYRLMPFKCDDSDGQTGMVNTAVMYDNMMNKFKWGKINTNPSIYLDETNMNMTTNFRSNFVRLAEALVAEGKKDSAIKVLDRCLEVLPEKVVPYNVVMLFVSEAYYKAGAMDKGNKVASRLIELFDQKLAYLFSCKDYIGAVADKGARGGSMIANEKEQGMAVMQRFVQSGTFFKQDAIAKKAQAVVAKYESMMPQRPQQQRQ